MSPGVPDAAGEPTAGPARGRVRGDLAVAMPTYNGRDLLEVMLASIARQTVQPAEVIVVDDCSDDATLEYLRETWPDVRVVAHPSRRGVTAAMNTCIRAARTDLVALFNNDMELRSDCLERLVAELDRRPEVGSVTPKMLDLEDPEVFDGAGDLLSWRGGGRRRGHGERDVGQYELADEVFGPCGGAAVFRRRALAKVGGFDEAYFAYYEDIDWAFRAQLLGFRCRYVPAAVLYHRGSATLGRGMTDFNGYHLWRNPVWLIAKCYPGSALLRHAPSIGRGQLGNFYTALRERKTRVWTRAMRDALRGLPAALRRRRDIQRTRVIGFAELERVARAGGR